MEALLLDERMFEGRDHLQTAVYEFWWDARIDSGVPAALALDRGYSGVIAIAMTDDRAAEQWVRRIMNPTIPLVVALRRERLLVSVLGEPAPHLLLLAFVDGDVLKVWRRRVAPKLVGRTDIGFASPFLATIPGTDAYTDKL
jgi:hypothetical protein